MLLPFSRLSLLRQNPNLLIKLFPQSRPLPRLAASHSPMATAKVVAEYAKSSRSSCKQCGKTIPSGSLRVGLSTKDPRGFDLVKWHHLDCFPARSHPLGAAAEDVKGFSSLKDCDQEALRKLEADSLADPPSKRDQEGDDTAVEESEKKIVKKRKVHNKNAGSEDLKVNNSTVEKLSTVGKEPCLEISFSPSETKNMYKDAILPPNWKAYQTIIFSERCDGLHDSEKIAALDFDGCLVNTSVKRVGPDAWSLMYPSIPDKLQGLYNSGYKLVIFTNESNIERWKNKRQAAVDSKIGRLENFMKHVNVPMQVFIACGLGKSKDQTDDSFRKPKPGMWKIMEAHFNSGISIDMDQSFYVGDAAGRVNDHSDADIKFAEAIGLKFHVPEKFFCS